MRYWLLLLIATVTFSGEAINPAIKPTLDTYETDVSKAYADYLKSVNKVNEKTSKDLDTKFKAAMKKGDLELANAIKLQMEEINKGKTRSDLERKWNEELAKGPESLLGPVTEIDPLVGKWGITSENAWEFKADGTGLRMTGGNTMPVKWIKNEAGGYSVTFPAFNQIKPLIFQGKDSIQISPGLFPRMK